jgi:two-component SAPR family response regulator
LVTACPYCLLNFKDSVVTSDKGRVLEVKDISVVLEAWGMKADSLQRHNETNIHGFSALVMSLKGKP